MKIVALGPTLALALCLLLPAPPADAAASESEMPLWRALDWFQGAWSGREEGVLGKGRSQRCTDDMFEGRFMLTRTRTDLEPRPGLREIGDFQYWQMLGRDPDSGRITLEQFESAGYHRRFELMVQVSRPDLFVFEATELGDNSNERAGRLTLRVLRNDRYEEALEMGEDMTQLRRVRSSRWSRIATGDHPCTTDAFELPRP